MRILLINHHPDCLYYQHEALKHAGYDVVVADEQLNRLLTPDGSTSTREGMFDLAGTLFPISKWDFNPVFVSTLDSDDIIFTIHGDVAVNPSLSGHKVIMDIRNHQWLSRVRYGSNITLITNHPNFGKEEGVHYVPNFVGMQPMRTNPKSVTMINSVHPPLYDKIHEELADVAVEVGNNPYTKVVEDDNTLLDNCCMFAYQKTGGIHYYAVNKALNKGIPVYLDNHTYENGGFQDLPRDLFIFSEQYTPTQALQIAKSMDPEYIQSTYRESLNVTKTSEAFKLLLENIYDTRLHNTIQ